MRNALIIAMLAVAGAANAASITTLFASNNNGSAGGGNYFTVTVGANAINVTGFAVNTGTLTAGSAFGFSVYTCATTHVGNEAIPGNWTLRATGSGTAAGANLPSLVSNITPFQLAGGSAQGMAIALAGPGGPSQSLFYTNGTGANQNYSNADVSLSLGTATNVLFTAPLFSPRVWNGTIEYNVVPEPATMAILGLGVVPFLRRRRK